MTGLGMRANKVCCDRWTSLTKPSAIVAVGLLALVFAINGCKRKTEITANTDCSQGQNCTGVSTANTRVAAKVNSAVSRITFIDLEESCDCTRRRIEASWNALQSAIGVGPNIPIDRIHLDSQEALAEPYREQRPFQVMPAIYFMDSSQSVIEMLQGEVSEKQISDVLKGVTH